MTQYASSSELRAQIDKQTTSGAGTDANLNIILLAVSAAIDGFCNRPDGFVALATAAARVFPGTGKPYIFIDECVSVSGVATKSSPSDTTYDDAWAASDFIACSGDPKNPNFNRLPYTCLISALGGDFGSFLSGGFARQSVQMPTVQVTAKWGYAVTVPDVVKQATLTESIRIWKRAQSAFADALANGDFGSPIYVRELDPVTKLMLVQARMVKPAI